MAKDSPILVRIFKEESELEVWKQDRTGRYALLKTYPICRWSGELGPKINEGDRQAPEGFYTITPGQMNPNSQYYLAFNLGYPNAYDRAHGRTGANLMVHGDCSSRGCYAMTDEQISEIFALGREAFFGGQRAFQVQAYPFRMTPENMAKHRNNPHMAFWKMLKHGNDHFEVTRLEPKVDVCEKHYVFDAQSRRRLGALVVQRQPANVRPITSPTRSPPRCTRSSATTTLRSPSSFAAGRRPRRSGPDADGGMHPMFVEAVKRNQIGVSAGSLCSWRTAPGTIPTNGPAAAHPGTRRRADHGDHRPADADAGTRGARTGAAPRRRIRRRGPPAPQRRSRPSRAQAACSAACSSSEALRPKRAEAAAEQAAAARRAEWRARSACAAPIPHRRPSCGAQAEADDARGQCPRRRALAASRPKPAEAARIRHGHRR